MTADLSGIVVIEGLLLPAARDSDGKALGLSIATFDEQTYLVKPGLTADAMTELLGNHVRVTGRLHFGRGRKTGTISVEEFEPLPHSEPDFWS